MLERTAASLESSSFHRILPSSVPFKSSRRLHTSFWHHGAAEIELSSVWQALAREPLDSLPALPTTQASNKGRPESLRASTTLLDFLYPQGTISLPKRPLSWMVDRHDRPRAYFGGTVPRLFTSAAANRQRPKNDDIAAEGGQKSTTDGATGEEDVVEDSQTSSIATEHGPGEDAPVRASAEDGQGPSSSGDAAATVTEGDIIEDTPAKESSTMEHPTTDDLPTMATKDGIIEGAPAKEPTVEATQEPAPSSDAKESITAAQDVTTNDIVSEDAPAKESTVEAIQEHPPSNNVQEYTAATEDVTTNKSAPPQESTAENVQEPSPPSDAQPITAATTLPTHGADEQHPTVDSTTKESTTKKTSEKPPPGQRIRQKSQAILAFESAMQSMRKLPAHQQGAEFETIWAAYHSIKLVQQPFYDQEFLGYAIQHRTQSEIFALALRRERHRFLVRAWEHFGMPNLAPGSVHLDWAAFENVFTIDELGLAISSFIGQMKLMESRPNAKWPEEVQHTMLYMMIFPLIRQYAEFYSQSACVSMLVPLQNRALYEHFLRLFIQKRKKSHADALYHPYRELVGKNMDGHIMENMLHKMYWPDNGAGMELAARDLYARYGMLRPGQHRRLLMYYARQGDATSVERQWATYEKQMMDEQYNQWVPNPEEFSPLLHVYAVRGELNQVRRIFTALQGKYGPELNTQCWNILLNAHAKAQEYEGAVRVFKAMRQTVELDRHSFGTMMGMTGSRGDIEFTLDMYRMAKEKGIEHDIAIIDSVVEVYCQNDRLADAYKICEIATSSGEYEPVALTTLWNTVLDHLAQQRDLVAMNRILTGMTQSNIPYDSETYEALLRGLALCQQASHAYYLIKEAAKTGSFKPDLHHYALLMAAFIRTKRPQLALSMSSVLETYGVPPRGHVLVRILQALGSWTSALRKSDANTPARRRFLIAALREFRTSVEQGNRPRKEPRPIHNGPAWLSKNRKDLGPDQTLLTVTRQARLLCFIFAQLREMATVKDVLEMWKDSSPQASEMANPPLMLLSTLMLAAYNDRNFDEVENIWAVAFYDTKQRSQVSASGTQPRAKALPGMRYILNDALRTMLRTYLAKEDPVKLKEVVTTFLDAGFELDSKNWNYYVQALASLKQWREAFLACEEHLMPHWMGWYTVIPLEVRRTRSNPRQSRPISFTLAVLTRAYMDLEQMAVWSTEAERLLNYVTEKCTQAVTAIRMDIQGEHTDDFTDTVVAGRPRQRPYDRNRHLERVARRDTDPVNWGLSQDVVSEKPQPAEASVPAEDGTAEDDPDAEDSWYDVDAQDEETWTPMKLDQRMKPSATRPASQSAPLVEAEAFEMGPKTPKKKSSSKRAKSTPDDSDLLVDSEGRVVQGFDPDETDEKPSF